jgi:hypothetical protein
MFARHGGVCWHTGWTRTTDLLIHIRINSLISLNPVGNGWRKACGSQAFCVA